MLTCHGCMRYCLQTVIGDSASLASAPRTATRSSRLQNFRRNYASRSTSFRPSEGVQRRNDTEKGGAPRTSWAKRRQEFLDSRGTRPATKEVPEPAIKIILPPSTATALRYLKNDPVKLADFVRDTLQDGDFDTALAAVREASKSTPCVVSWNHIVDYQLSQGKMRAAIKTFNEMKKRAQTPDAHTYTIIFRGCAEHKDSKQALEKVMAVYRSMLSEKSPVKPNTIHMNALLKMCSRAHDVDALMSVASSLPPKGVRAANNLTFTTILNSLRVTTSNEMRDESLGLSPMQKRGKARQAILQARYIWQDITTRWRQGDIRIDEELACAMGRLLLISDDPQDWDDVLSLIQQTMNIPRQVPALGTSQRSQHDRSQKELSTSSEIPAEEVLDAPFDENEMAENEEDDSLVNCFPAPNSLEPVKNLAYARPGQNSLSLVMKTLLNMRAMGAATKYWQLFTQVHGVHPDREDYTAYLRVLRVSRASTQVVNILFEMAAQDLEPKTFRIAMATCGRDKLNPHAFANAGKILDMMQESLPVPDLKVLQAYLLTAISSPVYYAHSRHHKHSAASAQYLPETKLNPVGQGKQILRALERLGPSFINIKSMLFLNDPSQEQKEETRALVRIMIAAHDRLMTNWWGGREQLKDLKEQRGKLAAFLNRSRFQGADDGSTLQMHVKPPARRAGREGEDGRERRAIAA